MSKITIVTGHFTAKPAGWDKMTPQERYNTGWKVGVFHRNGFWKAETIQRAAKTFGFFGECSVSHANIDNSGKGRSYDQSKFTVFA